MALTLAERDTYVAIIDDILSHSDLTSISEKRVRKEVEARIGTSLQQQKAAFGELVMERFDIINEKQQSSSPEAPLVSNTNGAKREAESQTPISETDDTPKPKKQKVKKPNVDADAKLAAQLQAAESRGARPSRSGVKKAPIKKKTPRKKSASKIKGDDDSDVELGSDGERKPKVVKKTGFHKPYLLSQALQDLVHEEKLPRTQVVKKIWEHVHALDLQDPTDKRNILCDEKMQAVFKVERVHMFTMNRLLGKHLYPCEDEPEPKVEQQQQAELKVEPKLEDEDDD